MGPGSRGFAPQWASRGAPRSASCLKISFLFDGVRSISLTLCEGTFSHFLTSSAACRRGHVGFRGSMRGSNSRGRGFASKKMVRVGDTVYAKTGTGSAPVSLFHPVLTCILYRLSFIIFPPAASLRRVPA